MSIKLSLPGPQLGNGIGIAPIIPDELDDVLWLQGMCEGVHAGLKKAGFRPATSSFEVYFTDLSIPVELTTLTDNELDVLSSTLLVMVSDSIAVLLKDMSQIDRPSLSIEKANDLIQLHSGRHINDEDERKGVIDLLNGAYLHAMAHNEAAPAITHMDSFAAAFKEIMVALGTLLEDYQSKMMVDRELVSGLWTICHEGKWLVSANAKIRRGDEEQEWHRIGNWIETIEYVIDIIVTYGDLDIPLLLRIALEEDYAGVQKV